MSSCDPNWVDLPTELWAAISRKHLKSIPDYLSFRGVCRSWRTIATLDNYDVTSRVPWLMYVSMDEKKRVESKHIQRREFANLFDLSTNKVQKTINFYPAGGKRYPSSQGWILCVSNVNREVYLTHPTSRVRIELPGSDTFPKEDRFIGKMVLSCNPAAAMKKKKIDDDLVVMVIWAVGKYRKMSLGFSRPGDSSWTVMDGMFADILYHNGKLYALDDSNDETCITVVEIDIHGPNPTQLRQVFSLPSSSSVSGRDACEAAGAAVRAAPGFVVNDDNDDLDFDSYPSLFFEKKYYLLESCGKFIIVIRHTDYGVTLWFEIFEFDFKDGRSSHCREIKQHDHWNKTLFLGFDSSVICCVDLDDDVAVKPNFIYFTDDHDHYWKTGDPFDMGVFCLKTGLTTNGFFDEFLVSDFLTPPTWVMPTLF